MMKNPDPVVMHSVTKNFKEFELGRNNENNFKINPENRADFCLIFEFSVFNRSFSHTLYFHVSRHRERDCGRRGNFGIVFFFIKKKYRLFSKLSINN